MLSLAKLKQIITMSELGTVPKVQELMAPSLSSVIWCPSSLHILNTLSCQAENQVAGTKSQTLLLPIFGLADFQAHSKV